MKRPRGGSLLLLLTPDELLSKLATLVPPPRVHGVRYHGVFAPNAKVRARVVPERVMPEAGDPPGCASRSARPRPSPPSEPLAPPAAPSAPPRREKPARSYRVPWADLLRKVFSVDVLACPDCGGRLRVLAFINETAVAKRILDCLGLDSAPPPIARAQAPPEAAQELPSYDGVDPVFAE